MSEQEMSTQEAMQQETEADSALHNASDIDVAAASSESAAKDFTSGSSVSNAKNVQINDASAHGTDDSRKRSFNKKRTFQKREKPEQSGKMSVLGIRRVAKVGKGAKRLSFSACVVVGDMLGSVGIGMGKGRDVNAAILQASSKARKMQIRVNLKEDTIPHQIEGRFCKSSVIIRNAQKGTGVKAGNVVRAIFTCLGVKDLVSKVIGNRNFLNVAHATMCALEKIQMKQSAIAAAAAAASESASVETEVA